MNGFSDGLVLKKIENICNLTYKVVRILEEYYNKIIVGD